MNFPLSRNHRVLPAWLAIKPRLLLTAECLFSVCIVILAMAIAFGLHFNLSTAGSIDLLLVVLAALSFGFSQATAVSLGAVVCLNYLFTPPVFRFTVADPQNWISLATFELTALLVSGLSSKARLSAEQAELQQLRSVKLYELSRAILLIDYQTIVTDHLARLIEELIEIDSVHIRMISERSTQISGVVDKGMTETGINLHSPASDSDDVSGRSACRTLRLGTSSIGAITMKGWNVDPLLADAVASLAAIAIERARAVERESRAAAERNAEQLRSAVLDGLAHGFKTPLTAIQTASSGLLAIGHLNSVQTELVTLINDQTTMLSQLSTRLLQTAALESREVRLKRTSTSIIEVVEQVIRDLDVETQIRITLRSSASLFAIDIDASVVELALLQLIDNAAKYSNVGSDIYVKITQSESDTSVIVENTGKRIPSDEKDKIFQRFYRGGDATRGPTGTGLGLSIVKKIAEAHGGTAGVESDEDITRFWLTLDNYKKVKHG